MEAYFVGRTGIIEGKATALETVTGAAGGIREGKRKRAKGRGVKAKKAAAS